MSSSKEQLTAAAAAAAPEQQPREVKCSRCRHHGIIVLRKGHTKLCPFGKCECWKCFLITQRTQIAALQRSQKRAQKRAQSKEQRPGVSVGKPPAEGVCTAAAPRGGARPSATSGMRCPTSGKTPERTPTTSAPTTTTTWSTLDLLNRRAAGGETVAGVDSGAPPLASSGEGLCAPSNGPFFGEFGQAAPLPVHFPFRMSGHHLSSYVPFPNFLLPSMPLLPPLSAGLYSGGLCGPPMFSHFELPAMHYSPPPEPRPPADCREAFFTLQPPPLPEVFQEEQQLPQPPLSNTEDRGAALKPSQDNRGTSL